MFLDAVLDINLQPLFNSTRDEVRTWLEDNADNSTIHSVVVGSTCRYVTVEEYLNLK